LRAALFTFWERGYRGTSMGDLVASMGVSRSSLYSVWGDKDGVFTAVLDLYDRMVVGFVLGPLEAPDADLAAIEGVLRGLCAGADQAPSA